MARFDIETLMERTISLLTEKINAKIAEINLEKNDSVVLKTIDANAFVAQSTNEKQINYDPFIYVGIVDIGGDPQVGYSHIVPDIAALVVVADEGQDLNLWRRLFRYQRAVREVFEENFDFVPGQFNLKVKNQVPVELALVNNSYSHKAIGVMVSAEIG